ncbi:MULTISPECIES: response regulator transcription factor [Methyloversatilis]|jgi:two-component system, LuxR family, response regulator FixJ|uniref:response regulator transcription factor n=1 Tax=Methyloversatilis TaxID=378210 RepID=UPI00037EF88A|nr:LuxR C-terminal-related transcriptional regulator [Methyloversatilis discipulorum]PZU51543.1 MAG: DNA-binding response regulator [Thauera sp.]
MARPLVCVVDDDAAMRRALCQALTGVDADVQGFSGAGVLLQDREALGRAACVLLNASLRGISGLDLQSSLRVVGNRAPVIFVSGPCDVTVAVRALRAGALDFMLMPIEAAVLRLRVTEALVRASSADARRQRVQQVADALANLTAREREVLDRVVRGLPNTGIAAELGISAKTVEQHRARVMDKMRAGSLAELVARVTEWRVLSESV